MSLSAPTHIVFPAESCLTNMLKYRNSAPKWLSQKCQDHKAPHVKMFTSCENVSFSNWNKPFTMVAEIIHSKMISRFNGSMQEKKQLQKHDGLQPGASGLMSHHLWMPAWWEHERYLPWWHPNCGTGSSGLLAFKEDDKDFFLLILWCL